MIICDRPAPIHRIVGRLPRALDMISAERQAVLARMEQANSVYRATNC
jgi:hypothetical protein